MPRYKKTNERPRSYGQYARFKEGKTTKITVSDWTFAKGMNYLFRCYVTKFDGKEVDQIWTVWDYESAQKLKKKLGTNYTSGSKELTVKMKKDDMDEISFDVK